ncbi:MAG: nitronate monooxygenase, partial [Mycobacteriales bacterium]
MLILVPVSGVEGDSRSREQFALAMILTCGCRLWWWFFASSGRLLEGWPEELSWVGTRAPAMNDGLMSLRTAFTKLLSVQHPVALAPMGGSAGGALAAAVSNGGGLGLVGGGRGDRDWLA